MKIRSADWQEWQEAYDNWERWINAREHGIYKVCIATVAFNARANACVQLILEVKLQWSFGCVYISWLGQGRFFQTIQEEKWQAKWDCRAISPPLLCKVMQVHFYSIYEFFEFNFVNFCMLIMWFANLSLLQLKSTHLLKLRSQKTSQKSKNL